MKSLGTAKKAPITRGGPSAFALIKEYLLQHSLTPEAVKNEHRLEGGITPRAAL
jgi:hypothetical protein